MKHTFLVVLLLLNSSAFARTLYLDCVFDRCVTDTQCNDQRSLSLHFMIDTTNNKAWRLADPTARPVLLEMIENSRYNMIDRTIDGSVEVTTIDIDMHASHSVHPMGKQSDNQVRQYYGSCTEPKMIASVKQR